MVNRKILQIDQLHVSLIFQDLVDIGITNRGHRNHIMAAIKFLPLEDYTEGVPVRKNKSLLSLE